MTLAAFATFCKASGSLFDDTAESFKSTRTHGLAVVVCEEELLAEISSCCPVPGTMHGNAMCARLRTARDLAAKCGHRASSGSPPLGLPGPPGGALTAAVRARCRCCTRSRAAPCLCRRWTAGTCRSALCSLCLQHVGSSPGWVERRTGVLAFECSAPGAPVYDCLTHGRTSVL